MTAAAEKSNAQGINLFHAGDFVGAYRAFDDAVRLDPTSARGWNNRGLVHRQANRLDDAAADFGRAAAADPSDPKPLGNRAAVRRQAGDLRGADADYTAALGRATGSVRVDFLLDRALVRQELGDLTAAAADCTAALAADPTRADALELRGRVRTAAGDLAGATDDLNRALALCSRDRLPVVLHARGAVAVERKRFADAIADYDRAVALDPNYTQAYISRGHAYYHLRSFRQTIADYRRAHALNPKMLFAELVRITRRHATDAPDETLANCRKHVRITPDDVVAHMRLGITLQLLGHAAEANIALKRAGELDPQLMADCRELFVAVAASPALSRRG